MGKSFPVISKAEFESRMDRFKEKMHASGIDLAVMYSNLLDPSAVRYFSDFSAINENAALVVPLTGDPILCSGFACHEWSRYKSKVADIRIMPEVGEVSDVVYDLEGQMDFLDLFKEIKNRYRVKRIGLVGRLIFPQVIYEKMTRVFPEAEIVYAEKQLYELRIQKSADEIACVRKACEIMSDTFRYAVPRIIEGVTELDVQADLESQMLRLGAESYVVAFSPAAPSGAARTNLCMNRNSLKKIINGEMVAIGAGACYEGYNGIINAPVVVGHVSNEIKEAVKIAHEALLLVAENLKPGANAAGLYKLYMDFLKKHGCETYSPYACVHSIGLMECENPFFAPDSGAVVTENMTLCIDAYFKGLPFGSFRIEDTFLINKNGAEALTSFNAEHITKFY